MKCRGHLRIDINCCWGWPIGWRHQGDTVDGFLWHHGQERERERQRKREKVPSPFCGRAVALLGKSLCNSSPLVTCRWKAEWISGCQKGNFCSSPSFSPDYPCWMGGAMGNLKSFQSEFWIWPFYLLRVKAWTKLQLIQNIEPQKILVTFIKGWCASIANRHLEVFPFQLCCIEPLKILHLFPDSFGLLHLPWPAPDVKAGKHVDPYPRLGSDKPLEVFTPPTNLFRQILSSCFSLPDHRLMLLWWHPTTSWQPFSLSYICFSFPSLLFVFANDHTLFYLHTDFPVLYFFSILSPLSSAAAC